MADKFATFLVVAIMLAACSNPPTTTPVTNRNSQLTHGNVQLTLAKGETTQTEVLENFGAPNVSSIDGNGYEVWTYQRQATNAQIAVENWGIFSRDSTVGVSQSQRTITLIIKFDETKTVHDFKSRTSSF